MTTRSKYGVVQRGALVATLTQQMRDQGMSARDAHTAALHAAYPERVVEGQLCDSVKEAQRYRDLLLMQHAELIRDLEYHHAYALHVRSARLGLPVEIGAYVADFVYWRLGQRIADAVLVVEDVKGGDEQGTRTALYAWKRKHVEAEYGITITEV